MEMPEQGNGWRLVEFRPVSEGEHARSSSLTLFPTCCAEFADPPPPPPDLSHLSISSPSKEPEPVVPAENPPSTLIQWAVLILNTPDPMLKVH